VVTLLAVAVLVAMVVRVYPRHTRPAPRATPARPASVSPPPPVTGPAGAEVLAIGQQLAWLDVGSGQVTTITAVPSVPEDGFADAAVGLASGTAVLALSAGTCQACSPAPGTIYYVPRASARAERIGAANWLAQAASDRSLWVIGDRAGASPVSAEWAQAIDDTGRSLTPRIDLPAGTDLYRGVRDGMLLRTRSGTWEIWNPARRAVTARFRRVIASTADRIAWLDGRRVIVTSLSTGAMRTLRIQVRTRAGIDQAAFSPDGTRLALAVGHYSGAAPNAAVLYRTVTVADVSSGQLTSVPGANFAATDLSAVGWSSNGRWLLLATGEGTGNTRLFRWRPGAARLQPARDSAPSLMLVVGPPPKY
jgi:hypothetical protein